MAIIPINVATRGYLQGNTLGIASRGYLDIFVVIEEIPGGGAGGDFALNIIANKPVKKEDEEEIIMLVIESFLKLWD